MPQLIGALLVMWLVMWLVVWLISVILVTLLWLCINLIVLVDQVLGHWPFEIPAVSWAWNGFILGSLLCLIKPQSSLQLSPEARQIVIACIWFWVLLLVIIAMVS